MSYVDGFVIPLPESKIDEYRKMAEHAGKVWMEHGAIAYKECIAEDINSEQTKGSFLKAANAKKGETVVFAFIVYKSRLHRDEVNAKVMSDPRTRDYCKPEEMPFDFERMAYGGFNTLVDL